MSKLPACQFFNDGKLIWAILNTRDRTTEKLRAGVLCKTELRLASALAQPGVILDIGSNFGGFGVAVAASLGEGYMIQCFEV